MKYMIHQASERGAVNMGWLKTFHSFSFSSYYNAEKIHFGALRVLNDDEIDAGMGFGMHPHDNMEIITIPLEGDLAHKDSMGNSSVIKAGDVQVMSAGTGIMHSEFNANQDQSVKLFQIWVLPNKKNVTPRYQQITLDQSLQKNKLHQILSPSPEDAGVWIHQDAWFHMGIFDANMNITYTLNNANSGIYVMVIEGSIQIGEHTLNRRDAMGISDLSSLDIYTKENQTRLLVMELPMIW